MKITIGKKTKNKLFIKEILRNSEFNSELITHSKPKNKIKNLWYEYL